MTRHTSKTQALSEHRHSQTKDWTGSAIQKPQRGGNPVIPYRQSLRLLWRYGYRDSLLYRFVVVIKVTVPQPGRHGAGDDKGKGGDEEILLPWARHLEDRFL